LQVLSDSDVEQWAKHGPFAQDAAKRMTHDYQGKTYTDAFHGLLNQLMAPSLKLTTSGPGSLNAKVLLPGFTPEQSALSVECSAESGRRDISYIPPGSTNLSSWNDDQQLIKPVEAEVWLEEGDTQPRGYIYRYYLGAPPQGDKRQWRVRARHTTPQGVGLPLPENGQKTYDPHRVQESDAKSGWLYAERTEP